MQSISARLEGDLDPNKFMPWINQLTQALGPKILRCKGIVALKGDPKRFVFQGVHMMLDGEPQREWKPGEKRESKVVFIGRDLDKDLIRKGFLGPARRHPRWPEATSLTHTSPVEAGDQSSPRLFSAAPAFALATASVSASARSPPTPTAPFSAASTTAIV